MIKPINSGIVITIRLILIDFNRSRHESTDFETSVISLRNNIVAPTYRSRKSTTLSVICVSNSAVGANVYSAISSSLVCKLKNMCTAVHRLHCRTFSILKVGESPKIIENQTFWHVFGLVVKFHGAQVTRWLPSTCGSIINLFLYKCLDVSDADLVPVSTIVYTNGPKRCD